MISLNQHGRAGLQFLGSLQKYSSGTLRKQGRLDFERALGADAISASVGVQNCEAVLDRSAEIAANSQSMRFERFYQRYVAEQVYDRGIPAAEERRAAAEAALAGETDPERAGPLLLNLSLAMPDYYQGVEWHLQPGGWDGYDLSMPMFAAGIAPLVFAHGGYAAVEVGANIRDQRRQVIEMLPRRDYKRIYEPGSGGVVTLAAARAVFPNAELVGGDLSAAMQKAGHRMAGVMGLNVILRQEDSCHTAEADGSVGAVISYATFHELPDDALGALLGEMHRILEPGGDIVISDPPPLHAVDAMTGYLLDWESDFREEPYFGAHLRRDLPAMLRSAGFTDVTEAALGAGGYPWVTLAHKPEAG